MWIALGSVFSALEVIPLSLLMVEAYGQYRVIKAGGIEFPYKAAFWFLMATAFWNLFGAGVLGFLINLPFVSYFQHGSFLTAAHGHGALMGVYGMLAHRAGAVLRCATSWSRGAGRRSGSRSASGA